MLGLRKQATNKSQTLEPLPNSIFSCQPGAQQAQAVTAKQPWTSDLAVLSGLCHCKSLPCWELAAHTPRLCRKERDMPADDGSLF